jgi:RNA polymerase sigma factor (sigma-70 family)
LSYDPIALGALSQACRANLPGAWNLLLLAGSRLMVSYLTPRSRREPTEEAGDLFRWLAEAIQRGAAPFSYLKRAVTDHRRSKAAEKAREEQTAQDFADEGAILSHEGEERAWAVSPSVADPLLRKQLRAALSSLPPLQRRALWLSEVEEFSDAEIAKQLGKSPKTIRNLLSEARKNLRDIFGNVSANE